MRGKNQRTQQRRRTEALAQELQRLRTEIETETERQAAARRRAEQTRTAWTMLDREQAVTGRQLRIRERTTSRVAAAAAEKRTAVAEALQELRAVERLIANGADDRTLRQLAQTGRKIRL